MYGLDAYWDNPSTDVNDEEGGPYTLPVEVFESGYPVLVSRPEPVNMPISQELTSEPDLPIGPTPAGLVPTAIANGAGLAIGAAVVGLALAAFSGKPKARKRR